MSSKVGGGSAVARKASNGIHDIPSGSRKIVQSLKEIVNSPEPEIYAMLKECNMDPNETVSRLLAQDPFHEVKSKKEKKKEIKDIPDSRLRGANNTYNRGVRGGSDRYVGRSGSTNFFSTDSRNFQGNSTNKKESGTQGYAGSWSPASGVANHHQMQPSDFVVTENRLLSDASGGGISSLQPASEHQTAWFGAPGQMSMADIVKMGRPQNKTMKQNVNMHSEINDEHEVSANQRVPVKDEWPSTEKPLAPDTSSVSVAPAESEVCNGPVDFQSDGGNQHLKGRFENLHLAENGPSENRGADHVQPDSVAGGIVQEDDSGISSEFDDNPYKYQIQSHQVGHPRDEDDVSSDSANLQQLTVDSHYQEASHEEDRPAVVIPDHLLIHTEECSQLSFGSFGGFGSRPLSNNVEDISDVVPQIRHSDARNTEFYGDEHIGSTSNGNITHAPAVGNYENSLDSSREVLKEENAKTAQEHQYNTLSQSNQGYAYENAKQQLNTPYDASQANAQIQIQNLPSLSNVMQGYTHSVPSTLLAQAAQDARKLDFQYSSFPVAQSLQPRSSNNASSLDGQSISMPELLRGSGIPATQPTQQTLPNANIATGPALPQQLSMHPYSQPTMPLTHFANMIGYPLMPQNYPYMPSAFQQTFAGNNSSYHHQLAALLPQYKTNLSPSNLPQSATAPASAYGFGNSNVGPAGNFPINQQSAPNGTTHGYEDIRRPQYKESNHLLALQQRQNENSPIWHHGHGSRTMSVIPANTYYNLQAQEQQQQQQQQQQAQQAAGGYRQAQQQEHYGSHGYPNWYQSQTEMSLDRAQQNPRGDGNGSQVGQPSNQTQQLWQNSY